MNKYRGYAILFSLLGSSSLLAGIAVKDVFTFSPTIGWITGLLLFVFASLYAVKAAVEQK